MMFDLSQDDRAVVEHANRILEQRIVRRHMRVESTADLAGYLKSTLFDEEQAVFGVIFLTSKGHVISDRVLFRGTVTGCSVYAREVVKEAIAESAVSVIFYSNDPEGSTPEVSMQAARLYRRLKEALDLVDVNVIDQFIVSGLSSLSFTEEGIV